MRQDQATCALTVDGRKAPMLFYKREGGNVTAESEKIFPGGQGPQKALGGRPTVEDITLNGEFVPSRDHAFIRWLESRTGKGDATVVEQLVDQDGNVIDSRVPRLGILSGCNTGDYDENANGAREFEITVSAHGV